MAAAPGIAGLDAAVFSVGSDGTDGPTDAAGGYVDGESAVALARKGAGCVRDAAGKRCLPCTESSGWSAGDRTYRHQRERCGSGTAAWLTGKRRNIP